MEKSRVMWCSRQLRKGVPHGKTSNGVEKMHPAWTP